MKLDSAIIDEICDVIRASGAVPLPGGHGVWFSEVRSRFAELPGAPGVEARCYVCLTLLGDGDGEQRWNPKEWWPHALSWFDIYCPQIGERLNGLRWAYLLASMHAVAVRWCDTNPEHRHLVAYITDCSRRAEERLRQITRTAKLGTFLVSAPVGVTGEAITAPDGRWQMAATALAGNDADAAEMLHFMHILHSKLGLAQHSMDQRYSTRIPFYLQLKGVLEHGLGLPQSLLNSASRIAKAMAKTALLAPSASTSAGLDDFAARLPACFHTASANSQAPSRAMIERCLQTAHVNVRERLLAAYDLATIVADLAMDIFRSGGMDGPAFRIGAYDYLHSLVRYGPKMGDDAKSEKPPQAAPDRSVIIGKPMTRSFAERMRSGLLVEPAREHCMADLGITISAASITTRPTPSIDKGQL